ncbi:mechanosensitive ion channel family protein [Synechococcus sp. BL107]|uniref:mechanosensitive ion channel family protein n=1 Tax=Synechococcus sp. BL107 TaxID=313625 RepID=UPI000309D67F|nr:mechanosensitive ion channel family protein [Synechococcus sp. BL107]
MPDALIDIAGGIALTFLISFVFKKILPRLANKTKSNFDDFIIREITNLIFPLGSIAVLFLAERKLQLPGGLNRPYELILTIAAAVVFVRLINRLGIRLLQGLARRSGREDIEQLVRTLFPLLKSLTWIVVSLIVLQSQGVKLTVVWGLLSAGGIGLGLALKEPAQELFAYLMILIDKPFTIGQFIAVDSVSATVEKIGVRSTHLRSLRGEIVVINNSTLTSSNIENFATMQQRRMIYSIGVTYQTTADQIQSIPTTIQSIIENTNHTIFNRCHFTTFGDYSLNFEIVYYIDNRDYTLAMDIQQSINLSIMRKFEEQGIEFAFPSQTLYLEGNGISAGAAPS